MSFNPDRGLLNPLNGILMIDDINFNDIKLKPNENQKYYEGPNINAFGGWQLENVKNDLKYIKEVQNKTDETDILDSTLFSTQPIDNDIQQKMLQENPSNTEADDRVKQEFNSLKNLDKFRNQLTVLNGEPAENQLVKLTNKFKQNENETLLLNLIQKMQQGKEFNLDFLTSKEKSYLNNIVSNQTKNDFKKVNDIKRFVPELSKNISKVQIQNETNPINEQYGFGF
jgi:type VI protein secretion system component VasK